MRTVLKNGILSLAATLLVGSVSAQTPNVVSVSPGQNALNVAVSTTVSITFDIDMDETTIDGSSVNVYGLLTGPHAGSVSYDNPTRTAIFTPSTPFALGEEVKVDLTTDIASQSGVLREAGYSWSFRMDVNDGVAAFSTQASYPTGQPEPWAATGADLDGDGDVDLITGGSSDSLSIMLNDGSGGFALTTSYAVGTNPRSPIAFDMDGDGDLDIVVANLTSDVVSVLLNYGDGSFAPQTTYPTGVRPWSVAAADFDGDGDCDIATANDESHNITVLMNNGDGSLATAVPYASGEYPRSIKAADFNGDGQPDLVVANQYQSQISILINSGDGTFEPRVTYPAGVGPWWLTEADLDADGDLDLVTANLNFWDGSIGVLFNNGDGSFATPVSYDTQARPRSVPVADIDNDGDLDLILVNSGDPGTVELALNDGLGGFSTTYVYPVGKYPQRAIVADFDNDGDMDMVTNNWGSDNVTLLYNRFELEIAPTALSFVATEGGANPFSQDFGIESNGDLLEFTVGDDSDWLSLSTSSGSTLGIVTASVDITGLPAGSYYGTITISSVLAENSPANIPVTLTVGPVQDILATVPMRSQLGVMVSSDVTATFGSDINESTLDASSFVVYGQSSGPHAGTIFYDAGSRMATFNADGEFVAGEMVNAVLTTDIESDMGNPMAEAYTWSFVTQSSGGSGVMEPAVNHGVGGQATDVYLVDLDGDSDLDIATANWGTDNLSVRLNTGGGTYDPPTLHGVGDAPTAIYSADLNGDGLADLVTANEGSDDLSVVLNTGNGTFGGHSAFSAGDRPMDIVASDFNGDGMLDLATANNNSDNISVLLNAGDGTYPGHTEYAAEVGGEPHTIIAADLDGDGDTDLASTNSASHTVSLFFNNGDGTFAPSVELAVEIGPFPIAATDVDADGDWDLVIGSFQFFSVLINDGLGGFAPHESFEHNDVAQGITLADFDSDGDIDLGVANLYTSSVSIYTNNGAGPFERFTEDSTYDIGFSPTNIFAADVDGDMDMDLITANMFSDSVTVLLNQSGLGFVCGDVDNSGFGPDISDLVYLVDYMFTGGLPPPALASADVDGSGTQDIADLVYIVDYMFTGGPAPVACP